MAYTPSAALKRNHKAIDRCFKKYPVRTSKKADAKRAKCMIAARDVFMKVIKRKLKAAGL